MTGHAPHQSGLFILSAFDRDQWCPVLQTRFQVEDTEVLRKVLGSEANDDPDFWKRNYWLEPDELVAVVGGMMSVPIRNTLKPKTRIFACFECAPAMPYPIWPIPDMSCRCCLRAGRSWLA